MSRDPTRERMGTPVVTDGMASSLHSSMRPAILTGLCLLAVNGAAAQSLRGSSASVNRMYTGALTSELEFMPTKKSLFEAVRDGELVPLHLSNDVDLERVKYPYVLPRTKDFVVSFAKKYHASCGERLVVTSAARPSVEQPRNASPKSVHPTGMAVDFRKPSGACLKYMRAELLAMEKSGMLEATEERHPVHFHVAVMQRAGVRQQGMHPTQSP